MKYISRRESFNRGDAQVFADLASKVVVNFVVAGDRRGFFGLPVGSLARFQATALLMPPDS